MKKFQTNKKLKKAAYGMALSLMIAGLAGCGNGQEEPEPTGQEGPPQPTSQEGQQPSDEKEQQPTGQGEQQKPNGVQSSKEVAPLPSLETLFQNDFLLYYVNCASTASAVSGGLGLFQTTADQAYGMDGGSSRTWGYTPQSYMVAEGDTSSEKPQDSKWVLTEEVEYADDTGYYYSFELPAGKYEVTCGFYDPFSARTIDVRAEGAEVIEGLKILKYKDVSDSFEIEVTDGELNLFIYNSQRGKDAMRNPILSYITVKSVPEYSSDLVALLVEDTALSEEELAAGYYEASTQEYREKWEEAQGLQSGASEEECRAAYLNLKEAFGSLKKRIVYSSFRPGKVWVDTDGTKIQAHGGQVQKLTIEDRETGETVEKWWWVGEDKTLGYRGGICAYSSEDLYNWKFEGVVMRNVSSRSSLDTDEYFQEVYAGYTAEQLDNVYMCINDSTSVIERPKMIYNEKTKKYIMWFHADGPTETSDANYAAASAGVAVSDSPYGPFRFVDRYRLNVCPEDQEDMYPQSKGMARDMNLFIDEDGTAYIIYSSEENLTIYISKLNDTYDYLCTPPEDAVYGVDFVRLYPGAQREAPAILKKDGKYYMMTSGATGWSPNQARYWVADEIFGEWENKGDPCVGDTKYTTFDSQSTCIFVADDKTIIYMGDRWNSDNLSDSRYVWLPLSFDGEGGMQLEWTDEWTLEGGN